MSDVKIIECPRDAMQGLHEFIPTEKKVNYINTLLLAGFDAIDCGSFVSPKAIPQMKDTGEVLDNLDLDKTQSKLLTIVANERGASDACTFEQVDYLGFPFSISETFQQRNTNSSIEESLNRVKAIQELCVKNNKQLVIYISMAFGNPYGDDWNADIVLEWVDKLHTEVNINIISLADTIGTSNPDSINYLFSALVPAYGNVEFGAHLHTRPDAWEEKVQTAWENGCRRFDGAIKGFGGCPMADDDLTGNMPTENIVTYFNDKAVNTGLDESIFAECITAAQGVFPI